MNYALKMNRISTNGREEGRGRRKLVQEAEARGAVLVSNQDGQVSMDDSVWRKVIHMSLRVNLS